MNGSRVLIDTNIVIYLLSGDETIAGLLDEKTVHVSFVTELELLSYGSLTNEEEARIKDFLTQCVVVDINPSIKTDVIRLRKNHRIKLPDSIIMASALYLDIPVITADKDFQKVNELQLVYYEK